MKSFKNKYHIVLFGLLLKYAIVLGASYGILYLVDLNYILHNTQVIFILALLIIVVSYIYLGLTTNDLFISNESLKIRRSIPGFRRLVKFDLKDIEMVRFRHDWTDHAGNELKRGFFRTLYRGFILELLFPTDYKWIEVISKNKTMRFYCFGIEYDYYDNPQPHFKDIYFEFAKFNIRVEWTIQTTSYHKGLQKRRDEIYKRTAHNNGYK